MWLIKATVSEERCVFEKQGIEAVTTCALHAPWEVGVRRVVLLGPPLLVSC